jgi:hypothetical protein
LEIHHGQTQELARRSAQAHLEKEAQIKNEIT